MRPRIQVRPQTEHGNLSFGICLIGGATATRHGYAGLTLMRVYTRDAADDWITRLKSIKSRSTMRRLLLTHATWIPRPQM
jgi:hypothetical protein